MEAIVAVHHENAFDADALKNATHGMVIQSTVSFEITTPS